MVDQKLWTLIECKLSGKTSPAEEKELKSLLQKNAALQTFLQSLFEGWELTEDPELAYKVHLERCAKKGIHIQDKRP